MSVPTWVFAVAALAVGLVRLVAPHQAWIERCANSIIGLALLLFVYAGIGVGQQAWPACQLSPLLAVLLAGIILPGFTISDARRYRRGKAKAVVLPEPKTEPHVAEDRPRLRVVRAFVDQRMLSSPQTGILGTPFFAHILVQNDPDAPTPNSVARDVLAQISYLDAGGAELLAVTGRWGDTDQPVDRIPVRSTIDLQRVEIGIGMTRELNLAMKYGEDADCYGFSNETYQAPDWRLPQYHLSARPLRIRVRLRGVRIDEQWEFVLNHGGAGSGLAFQGIGK